ncbi:hypothetical protein BSKO_07867 [Bryopsis sp. KO-2023]|nr:hypothetical protein BSKO_07867 [Bryopsis sp. KO-2023]
MVRVHGEIDVPITALGEILKGIHRKRVEISSVQNSLNEAPRGVADLLGQSRNFVSSLSSILVEGSEISEKVKDQLLDESTGFSGQIARLPFGPLFDDIDRVKEELRIADGYQSYIVAPEDGLNQLFGKAVEMIVPPVMDLVDSVHATVAQAVEKALRAGCEVPGIGDLAAPVVRFPNFVENVLPVAQNALEDLRDEARETALNVVEMEKSFLSCSFFRYLTFKRLRDHYDRANKEPSDDEDGVGKLKKGQKDDDGEEEDFDDNLSQISAETPRSVTPQSQQFTSADSVFVLSGYLEKSSSHSRSKAIKAESSLWQKRFFGIIEESRIMEYYSNEEAFLKGGKARGIVDLSVCKVEETDGDDLPTSSVAKSVDHLDRRNAVSLLIKIRAKDPRDNVFKNNKDLILRAPDASEKYKWFSHLKTMCNDSRHGAVVASWSSKKIPEESSKAQNGLPKVDMEGLDELGDPMQVGHGLGAAVFWSSVCRDEHNTLLPSPGIFLEGDVEMSMEKALKQHTRDMHVYTRLVCQTLTMTIPKVVVHCLVDRSRERLGPVMEGYLLSLSEDSRKQLLEEDPGLAIHRDTVKELMAELGDAEDKVKLAQRENSSASGDNPTTRMPLQVISVAGMMSEVSRDKNPEGVYKYIVKPPRAKTPPPARSSGQPLPSRRSANQPPAQASRSTTSKPSRPAPSVQRQPPAPPGAAGRRPPPPPPGGAAGGPRPVMSTASKQQAPSQVNLQRQQGKTQGFFNFRPFGQ